MNKELIKHYINEFTHWLNDGSIRVVFTNDRWIDSTSFDWSDKNNIKDIKYIIINDEYVEFRRALAEGKTVQYYKCVYTHEMCCNLDKYEWTDLQTSDFDKTLKYRIKPEEPQFKVGDWVRDSRDNNLKQVINPNSPAALSDYIKWKPQPGEWCWFYDNNHSLGIKTNTVIAKFSHMYQNMYVSSHLIDSGYFYNCEPFIGELPTHLQQLE